MTVHRFELPDGTIPAFSEAAKSFLERLDRHGASADDARGILAALLVRLWQAEPHLTLEQLHNAIDAVWQIAHGNRIP